MVLEYLSTKLGHKIGGDVAKYIFLYARHEGSGIAKSSNYIKCGAPSDIRLFINPINHSYRYHEHP